jgi:hypothetical protein
VNRGQRSADSFKLPDFYLAPRREKCFPGYNGGEVLAQPLKQVKEQRILDLNGQLDANLPASVRGEIEAKVKLVQDVKSIVKGLKMEAPDYGTIVNSFSAAACPELADYIRNGRLNGGYIVIGDVFFAEGEFELAYTLQITGKLQLEAKDALSRILTKFGFKGFSLDIAGSGEYQVLKHSSFTMTMPVPIAFRPLFLDDRDLNNFTQQYLKKGIYKKIASWRNDERQLRSLLTEFGIKEFGANVVFASLSNGEKLIPFDRTNGDHLAYLDFILLAGNK